MFVYKTGDKITTLKITAGNRTDEKDADKSDMLLKKIAKDMKYKKIDAGDADYHFTKEEVEITETHFSIGQNVIYHGPKNPITPIKAKIIGMASPQTGAYYFIRKADGENTYAAPEQMKLDEAMFDVRLDVDGSVSEREAQTVSKMLNGKGIQAKVEPSEKDRTSVTIDTSKSKDEVVKALGNIVDESKKRKYVNEGAKLTYESLDAVKKKAEKTGMPYSILKQVYDRGMAAWKGGHRPGAGQHQWALARVNSFVTKSSGTWGGADSDLAKKVKGD